MFAQNLVESFNARIGDAYFCCRRLRTNPPNPIKPALSSVSGASSLVPQESLNFEGGGGAEVQKQSAFLGVIRFAKEPLGTNIPKEWRLTTKAAPLNVFKNIATYFPFPATYGISRGPSTIVNRQYISHLHVFRKWCVNCI